MAKQRLRCWRPRVSRSSHQASEAVSAGNSNSIGTGEVALRWLEKPELRTLLKSEQNRPFLPIE
jgi:hypothetical protein